jgi:stage II sporulation protein D
VGLVASRDGRIIEALYSSSMGGATENNEWIFNLPSSQLPGTNVTPYLRGIYDGNLAVPPDTTTEAGIAAFYAFAPRADVYDDCSVVNNRFSRWRYTLTGAQLRARFTSNAGVTVRDVEVLERMPSGRVAVARVTLSTGAQLVRGWDALRNMFRPAASSSPVCGSTSVPAMVLNNPSVLTVTKNADGSVATVTVLGGGWGHNVGMSQYGAHGRGRAGQTFLQILKSYYTGADIGSYPIDIGREQGGPPTLRQQFYAPGTTAKLYVRDATMRKLRVHLNATYDIALNEDDLADGEAEVDLTGLVTPGLNTIQYNVVGQGEATVNVTVE